MPSSPVCPEEEPRDIATVEAESDREMDVDEEASAFLRGDCDACTTAYTHACQADSARSVPSADVAVLMP